MKKSATLLLAIFGTALFFGLQAQDLPKSGAALKASDTSIELKSGDSKSIELNRLRSKSYKKAKFGSIKVNTPEGLTAVVKSDDSNQDLYYVSLEASEQLTAGKYTLTIQGEGRNASKVKGTMISILVGGEGSLAAQN